MGINSRRIKKWSRDLLIPQKGRGRYTRSRVYLLRKSIKMYFLILRCDSLIYIPTPRLPSWRHEFNPLPATLELYQTKCNFNLVVKQLQYAQIVSVDKRNHFMKLNVVAWRLLLLSRHLFLILLVCVIIVIKLAELKKLKVVPS